MAKRSSPESDGNNTDSSKGKKQKVKLDKESSNFKLINTSTGPRVSQACDRCRIKKIKCDGLRPCLNCSKINFECKTSDKLTRRAFPKGYTENLENKVKLLEEQNRELLMKLGQPVEDVTTSTQPGIQDNESQPEKQVKLATKRSTVPTNNPVDQIFNLDTKGIIIGNDNLNFESQFNHLLINLNLPFLKITNSHNYLLDDPNSYLYHPSSAFYNQFHNKDLNVIYNPLTSTNKSHDDYLGGVTSLANSELPIDIYELFIKLINNFKKIFNNKKELDNQITQFFLNYNIFIPIFDHKKFMESYDNFHTMYPFMFTYDDATINGFNLLNNDYSVVNEYLMVVIQIYAIIMMNDPTITLNLLLNHSSPYYSLSNKPSTKNKNVIRSLYDFLPYFNAFHVSLNQLQTYLLFLYHSLLTNNKEKSLVLSSLINAFIGVLGINLNSKNLFFNDLTLSLQQRRDRVKIFWSFKVLLKCFNLKFGFKPSLNTTVINPVTIERYFQLTPEKLSLLLDNDSSNSKHRNDEDHDEHVDELFKTLLKPSIEFLNLVNIIIPSSFSPNYYQYLKSGNQQNPNKKNSHPKNLDWILNDEDGDGNDGNLNYNFTQFVTIDNNLSAWRESLKSKTLNLLPLEYKLNLSKISYGTTDNSLYHSIKIKELKDLENEGISREGLEFYLSNGTPDVNTAVKLIQIQLNFHYLVIRSQNYLNFIIDKELSNNYYRKLVEISKELLGHFIVIFRHITHAVEGVNDPTLSVSKHFIHHNPHSTGTNPVILDSLGLDVDEDGFVINDFSAKRRRASNQAPNMNFKSKVLPPSPFNCMLGGLSMTVINVKKTILLQMLYLLICSIKFIKKNAEIDNSLHDLIIASVDVFIKVFVNYQLNSKKKNTSGISKIKEDELYNKLMNDELRDQILREQRNADDNEEGYIDYQLEFENTDYFSDFSQISEIDWDDEEMDEDLKYLKILKFIKYKTSQIKELSKRRERLKNKLHQQDRSADTSKKDYSINAPPSIHNFYSSTSPPKYPPNLPKMPSISKLDYLIPEDNFPNYTMPGKFKDYVMGSSVESDLVKREKLAANDLMSLKKGYTAALPNNLNKWKQPTASKSPH